MEDALLKQQALQLWNEAVRYHMQGELQHAIALYTESIETYPTAEAYTFRGWAYQFLGRIDDAIEECKKAIEVDPSFGNPYNDIGAYLIELGQFDEAIPWLQQAVEARRYEPRHFPHYNMGRAYLGKEMYGQAMRCFQEALNVEPRYTLARQALESLRRMLN